MLPAIYTDSEGNNCGNKADERKITYSLLLIEVGFFLGFLGFFLFCFVGWFFCLFVCFWFLGLHPWHMEVPRLGLESELQLPACTIATAMQDPSRICHLHHSSQECRIPNPLAKTRDWTCILMDTSWIHFCCSTMGTPDGSYFSSYLVD